MESSRIRPAGVALSSIVDSAESILQVRKSDLKAGDRIYVKTKNSVYVIQVMENNRCLVSGGWFDKKGLSPVHTKIVGCTWGGSSIKIDIVAACGLCVEFGNRLVTSPIKKIIFFPHALSN